MGNLRCKRSKASRKKAIPAALGLAMGVGTLTAASCIIMNLTKDTAEATGVSPFGDGNYTIISAADESDTQALRLKAKGNGNFYLYIGDKVLGAGADGTVAKQALKSGNNSQVWRIDTSGDGRSYFLVNIGTNKVLDFAGGTLANGKARVSDFSGAASKKFYINSEDQVVSDGWYTIGSANNTDYVLDIVNNDPSNGANVQIYRRAVTNAQKFYIHYVGKGEYTIATGSSGGKSVIELAGGKVTTATNIQQYQDNNTIAQRWRITKASDGSVVFTSAKSGFNLEFAGGNIAPSNQKNILVGGRTGLGNQRFFLQRTSFENSGTGGGPIKELDKPGSVNDITEYKGNLSGKTFNIQSAINENFQVEVTNSSIVDHTNVQLWSNSGTNNRKFRFESAGNGYYRIIARNSEKALAVSNGNVEQQFTANSDAQLWKVFISGDGKTVLQNKTGGYLSVNAATNGTNTVVDKTVGGAGQKFLLKETEYHADIKNGEYNLVSASNSKASLAVENNNGAGGVRIISVSNSVFGANAHKFSVNYIGDGLYTIKTASSGYNGVFDITGGKIVNGTGIQQYPNNDSLAQKWRLIRTEDNKYIFMSAAGNRVLTIDGDAANASVKLGSLGDKNTRQQFVFTAAGSFDTSGFNGSGNSNNNGTSKENLTPYTGNLNGKTFNIFSGVDQSFQMEITNSSLNSNAVVQIWQNSGTNNRKFRFESAGNGYYRIIARNAEKAVAVSKDMIVQQEVSNSSDQLWKVYTTSDGKYVIQNKNGRYLSVNGAKNGLDASADVTMGGNGQKFVIKETSFNQEVQNGSYKFTSAANAGTSLTVENASSLGGARIISVKNDVLSDNAHRFNVAYIGDGLYRVTTAVTDHRSGFDIAGGKIADGTTIQQYPLNNSQAQSWRILRTEGNKYIFMSVTGNKVITVDNDPVNSPVTLRKQNDSNNKQQFTFISATAPSPGGSTENLKSAGPLAGRTFNIQSAINSNFQLEITNSSIRNNTVAQLWSNAGTNNRKFRFDDAGNGYYKIIARNSEKALTVSGRQIVQKTFTGAGEQLWKVYKTADGKYVIQNKNGRYLSVNKAENGFDASADDSMGGNGQKFSLAPTEYYQDIRNGAYNLVSAADTNGALTVEHANQNSGARIIASARNNDDSQIFGVTYLGDGKYKIKTGPSVYKSVFDIKGGKVVDGNGIQQYTDNGSEAQTWRIIRTEDNRYLFMSVNGNKVITINGSPTNAPISLSGAGDDNRSQQFTFERASGYMMRGDRKYYFNENGSTPRIGIDISEHQGNIDWDKVKADGIDFAIIRVAYADKETGFQDRYAKRNIEECERIGMPYGVYLYSMATNEREADSEANFMAEILDGRKPKYGAFIDIEDTKVYNKDLGNIYSPSVRRKITDLTKRIVNGLKSKGITAGIYASESYFNRVLYNNELEGIRWIARYYTNTSDDKNGLPINYDWKIWQYSSVGRVNGIGTSVDMNTLISEY